MRNVSIYDGRELIGHVHGIGRTWRAFDARGSALPGAYRSMKAAVAAVNATMPIDCKGDASARMDGGG